MTKVVNRMPQWAVFRGDKIIEQGYYEPHFSKDYNTSTISD